MGPSGVAPMDLRPEAEASNLASGEDDFDAYEEDGEDEDDEDDDDDDDDESTEVSWDFRCWWWICDGRDE